MVAIVTICLHPDGIRFEDRLHLVGVFHAALKNSPDFVDIRNDLPGTGSLDIERGSA